MLTNTHAHRRHCTTRQCVATATHNQCTSMHAHTYTHVYTCIRMHISYTHAYIYIYTCLYIYIPKHIYTHTYEMYICTHARTPGTTAWRKAQLEATKLFPPPCPLQSGRESPSMASSLIDRSRGTTDKRRTTTTNRSSSHHNDSTPPRLQCHYTRSSVLVRNQSAQSMAAPAAGHPIRDHAPRNRGHVPAIFPPLSANLISLSHSEGRVSRQLGPWI